MHGPSLAASCIATQALERLGRTPSPPPSHHHTCSDGGGGGIGGSGPGSWRCEGAAAGGLAGGVSGAEDECLLLLNALLLADRCAGAGSGRPLRVIGCCRCHNSTN